jgi:hypothetical protein
MFSNVYKTYWISTVLKDQDSDPISGAFLTPGSRIRIRMEKIRIWDQGSGLNNFLGYKNLNSLSIQCWRSGSGMEKSGSGINIKRELKQQNK